ncbi:ABC transporter, partial [Anaerostipes caccae]|nr:ABC transporter [Anaerostipes caccae]
TGQARRALIARALVHDPEALVFDEPCTGLDPEGMFYVRRSMRALAQAGKSIVLVTHYPEDVIPEIVRLVL